MKTTLYFVRHGETEWNVEGRIQGHLDIPLSDIGLLQAAALGRRLASETFDAIYSSDLIRAYRTASPVVANPDNEIVRDPRLRERHLGVLQGLTGEEALAKQPVAWKAFKSRDPATLLEGGESLGAFYRRITDFVRDILQSHAGGRVLAVTHGGCLDAAYRYALGMPLSVPRDFPIYNASVNALTHDGGKWNIDGWGDMSHLPRELSMDDS
jgi:probable phosphoglycerate mutase